MKVMLYGGTFDPPHEGHINLLRSAAACVRPDRIIVMPAGLPPHKAASATPAPLRLAMCRCFADALPGVQLSDWEMSRAGKSYTIDTVEMLEKRCPGAELFLCMGGDMLRSFEKWRSWRLLLEKCTLVCVCRDEDERGGLNAAAQALRAAGGRVLLPAAPVVEASSTELRQRMAAGESPAALLPAKAAQVAEEYRLYR